MNQTENGICGILGRLLTYPSEDIKEVASECKTLIGSPSTPGGRTAEAFCDYASGSSVSDMQELYTRTFEINPVCALEVGWQLFGERYERGTFIVKMRQTLRELELPESSELPDHLVHVLQALDRLEPEEGAEFASLFVLPAIDKMIKGFKDRKNIYRDVLDGIACEVRNRFDPLVQGVNHD